MVVRFLRSALRSHYALPKYLRAWVIVPATILLIVISGLGLTLPPGPLCDEGMILFMEGGCEWGDSNVFFFSKVGLLVALNVTFILAWRARVRSVLGFLPHFLVLALTVLTHLSGGSCDTYYSHPNGSIGQMALEGLAFGILGCAILLAGRNRTTATLVACLIAWNAAYPGLFYLGLVFTNHWTWLHTFMIVGGLALASAVVAFAFRDGAAQVPVV